MATYKNTRPTVIQLPNGKNVGPGAEYDADAKTMANPGMRIFSEAGYVVKVRDTEPPPAEAPKAAAKAAKDAEAKAAKDAEAKAAQVLKDAQETAGKVKRDAKIAAVKTADADGLLKMADGETDAEVNAAIEARAAELAPK